MPRSRLTIAVGPPAPEERELGDLIAAQGEDHHALSVRRKVATSISCVMLASLPCADTTPLHRRALSVVRAWAQKLGAT